MNLNIRPILSSLLRNRTGAVLVSLQIALALAILANATYIVKQRLDRIDLPSGLDEANLFAIDATGFTSRYDYASSVREDLAYLRGLNGVVDATVSSTIPLSGGGNAMPLYKVPTRTESNAVICFMYQMDEEGLRTLGSHLIAGRNFRKDEILPQRTTESQARPIPEIIVTEKLARALFPPDGNALGKTIYDSWGNPTTIIGISADMVGPWATWELTEYQHGIFLAPEQPLLWGFHYLVRTRPGQRDTLMRLAREHLAQSNPNRAITGVHSIEAYKRTLYLSERVTAIFLVIVITLLLAVAALGIFGLATFNVTTRTKQIGTRRALGARKRDVINFFLVENWLITTTGVVLGCALALGAGYWLSFQYQLPRLDLYYLVGGILVLWALGQAAAWQPARRAATVPPSVATRTA